MHDVTWFSCKGQTSTEVHGKILKKGSIPVCLVGANITFQISSTKFLLRREEYKNWFFEGQKRDFPL